MSVSAVLIEKKKVFFEVFYLKKLKKKPFGWKNKGSYLAIPPFWRALRNWVETLHRTCKHKRNEVVYKISTEVDSYKWCMA